MINQAHPGSGKWEDLASPEALGDMRGAQRKKSSGLPRVAGGGSGLGQAGPQECALRR